MGPDGGGAAMLPPWLGDVTPPPAPAPLGCPRGDMVMATWAPRNVRSLICTVETRPPRSKVSTLGSPRTTVTSVQPNRFISFW